jgi:hypothetical protein
MRLSRALQTAVSGLLVVSLTGCATMFNGSTQVMSIRSNYDDAKLYVNEEYIGKGNGTQTFKKKGHYKITARKEGCADTTLIPTKSFDPTTLLGILLDWGIISILIVDWAATGAVHKFDQTGYLIDPNCPSGAQPQAPAPAAAVAPDKTTDAKPKDTMNFNGQK